MKIQTYGKKSLIRRVYEAFTYHKNPYVVKVYQERGIGLYNPNINLIKAIFLPLFFFFCILTPFTNWMIPIVIKRWRIRE